MPPQPLTARTMPFEKYQPFLPNALPDRTWPYRRIEQGAPAGAASISATATRL